MEQLGQYILSVTAVAILTGLLCSLLQNGAAKEIARLLCSVCILLTILSPAVKLKKTDLESLPDLYADEAASAVEQGKAAADASMERIIKQEAEAYILDKAKKLSADITAQVCLKERVPAAVLITGTLSPYAKQHLQIIMTEDLGIPRENQVWKQEQ